MSYRDILLKQIQDLEKKISEQTSDKEELQKQLQRLKLAEFEEEMSSDGQRPTLLKG
jgi:predicted RNase H-like nuclease (RuvC/YqgF family)